MPLSDIEDEVKNNTVDEGDIFLDPLTNKMYITASFRGTIDLVEFSTTVMGVDHPELYETTKSGKMVQII